MDPLAYRHLHLLDIVKSLRIQGCGAGLEGEVCLPAESQDVSIAEQKAAVSLSYQGAVPVGAILRHVFGIYQRVDFAVSIVFIDHGVDPKVSLRGVRVVEDVLTGR
jgi:hypothetical protein